MPGLTLVSLIRSAGLPRMSSMVARLNEMRGLRRQRRALARIDPHLLKDIGVTPEGARREAVRPAWDVPRHWRS